MSGSLKPADLRDGSRVELRGLSKEELNGVRGVVQGNAASAKDRWAVLLDVSGKQMSVKACNICAPHETWRDDLELYAKEARGCTMRMSQAIKWYTRLNCLSAVAAQQIGVQAAMRACQPVTWNAQSVQLNNTQTRSRVLSHALAHHASVMAAIEQKSPSMVQLMAECLGDRNPTDADINALVKDAQGWSVHVEGDFYVEGYTDKGAVFVRVPTDATQAEEVYLVQACATPFTELLAPLEARRAANPDVMGAHVCVHTVLLPCSNTIAANLLIPGPLEVRDDAQRDATARRVAGSFERAQKAGRLVTHLNAAHLARQVSHTAGPDGVDKRKRAGKGGWKDSAFDRVAHRQEMDQPGTTKIMIRNTCWGPTLDGDATDPEFQRVALKVLNE